MRLYLNFIDAYKLTISISSRSCYPLNTILVDRTKLDNYLATHSNAYESSDDSDDSDTEGGSSSSVIIEFDTFMHEQNLLTSFFFSSLGLRLNLRQ